MTGRGTSNLYPEFKQQMVDLYRVSWKKLSQKLSKDMIDLAPSLRTVGIRQSKQPAISLRRKE